MIRIRGLSKSFAAREVLSSIDAEVPRGKIVSIVGPSGCGKSTLLRCMNGLEAVDAGTIEIASFTVTRETAEDRRALARLRTKVGMVFQEFHLFPHLTALENVALAPRVVGRTAKLEAEERARARLREVGMEDRAAAYPAELSGGQKQRVAIARALAQPIEVLLLDEPTSALDPERREEVRAVLREVAAHASLTIVLVTHEMRLATELADELWVLDLGAIVERGPPRDVVASPRSDVARQFFARERG